MAEKNIMQGGVAELTKIRKLLENQADLKKQVENLQSEKKRCEVEIESEEKAEQATIENTVKRRREQVVATFDKELANAQDKMRDARESKDKEKTKKVNKRIDKETEDLVRNNKNIMEDKKTYLKQKNISSLWDKSLTYILYFPKSLVEKLQFLLIALVCLVGIPLLLTKLTDLFWLLEALIFVAVIVLFVVIYMVGFEKTRMQNREAFNELYKKRREIKKNNKKIKKIKKRILKDRDESRYDLGKFDDDINEIEDKINDIVTRKNDALKVFEKETKDEIIKEIKSKNSDRMNNLKGKLEKAASELKAMEDKQKEVALKLTTDYAPYIGNENLNVRKIDSMIDRINSGQAKNISEAASIESAIQ